MGLISRIKNYNSSLLLLDSNYLQKITASQANKIIDTREPLGLFYNYDQDAEFYVGIDNSTGDAWTEEFKRLRACKKWLLRL